MADKSARELFLGEGGIPGTGDGSQHLYVNLGPAHPAMPCHLFNSCAAVNST